MRIALLRKSPPSRPDPRNTRALLAYYRAQHGDARMEDPPKTDPPADPPKTDPPKTDPPKSSDKGFPDNTPVAEMTTEQQAAYWRFHARKHQERADAHSDYDTIKAERDRLIEQHGSEQEKAVNKARDEAAAAERVRLAPQLVAAKFEAALAGRVDADGKAIDIDVVMAAIEPTKFLNDKGEVNTDMVTSAAAVFGVKPTGNGNGNGRGSRFTDLGQGNRGGNVPTKGAAGAAEAERRGFVKSSSK